MEIKRSKRVHLIVEEDRGTQPAYDFWGYIRNKSSLVSINVDYQQLEIVAMKMYTYFIEQAVAQTNQVFIMDSIMIDDQFLLDIKPKKLAWYNYSNLPLYKNLLTKPHMVDKRIKIFRPKLRCNHPKN